MLWHSLGVLPAGAAALADAISPENPAPGITAYLFGWGPLGAGLIALGWLLFRGWRLVSPRAEREIREEARADVVAERDRISADKHAEVDRLRGEKQAAERQRDEALQIARDQVAPLLQSFVATTTALIPLLQEIIRDSPSRRRRGGD